MSSTICQLFNTKGYCSNTLVEQINHLNQIAGEFSQFANIGNPKKEVFELNDELKLVLQLHSMADNVTIFFNPIQSSCKIEADKTQINRLFNNLILFNRKSIMDKERDFPS